MTDDASPLPASRAEQAAAGRARRKRVPRRALAEISAAGRDPLGILARQNATRLPSLVPLRRERMAASAFAFYRGTAALMAADLARTENSGIVVASCGDAHVANFGLYASPQRTLVFDLNDFDEAAWAPWEWDVKRLLTSIVIGGADTNRSAEVVDEAVRAAVGSYARSMAAFTRRSPLSRYFEHFDAAGGLKLRDKQGRKVVRAAIRQATRRTGERAAEKLTERNAAGRLRFIEAPPAMAHIDATTAARVHQAMTDYIATTQVDIRLLLQQYRRADTVLRAVGVGSVGTRCYVTAFEDGDRHPLLLQTKEAGRSVLVEFGGAPQPPHLPELVASAGEGARVVAMQRILQGTSDPFLGSFQVESTHFYVRQFRDMKGGFDIEEMEDGPFRLYAQACATTLARAHSQSPNAAEVSGYIGSGEKVADALLEWAHGYAAISKADYEAFVAAEV